MTALDLYKNIATGYTGAVKLTSTSVGTLGSVYTFTTSGANPDNGIHTFSVTLNSGGTQTITATDTTASAPNIAGTSNPITTRGLVVTSVTPTPTGFTATFNKAFVPGDVYLYNSNLSTTADVVMAATSDQVSFNSPSGTAKFIYNSRQASPTATFGLQLSDNRLGVPGLSANYSRIDGCRRRDRRRPQWRAFHCQFWPRNHRRRPVGRPFRFCFGAQRRQDQRDAAHRPIQTRA